MNFENYNKIYQEILDDDNNELSSNYLLNKYEIKHDEELINILSQIKKNEYISSDNTVINRLLGELDSNEDLLNINEIIDIKEKVISDSDFDSEPQESIINETIKEEKNNLFKESNKLKEKFLGLNLLDNFRVNLNIKYSIIITILIVAFISFFSIASDDSEDSNENKIVVEDKSIKDTNTQEVKNDIEEQKEENIAKEETAPETTVAAVKDENTLESSIEQEKTIEDTNKDETTTHVEIEYSIDETLDKIKPVENENNNVAEDTTIIQDNLNALNTQNMIILNSLDEIEKYKDQLKIEDGKLVFNNQSYSEDDILFGFKIFKLTSVYVKFQDEENQLRKRILLK